MNGFSREAAISFETDLPIPEVNLYIYRRVYVIEQWLRRIALATLMARYGARWNDAIPTEIGKTLKSRVANLQNRVAFDPENSDNSIWCLTLEELKALLTMDKTWPFVKNLTGFDRQELHARLDDLREIRNVIGHSRAATDYTGKIFEAIDEALDGGIRKFRDRLLYDFTGEQKSGDSSSDPVIGAFYRTRSPLGRQQIAQDEYFYYLYSLAPEGKDSINLGELLEHFDSTRRTVLAFLINRRALGEYTIIWPRVASPDDHSHLLDRFGTFSIGPGDDYGAQNPKYVCHPKIGFVY